MVRLLMDDTSSIMLNSHKSLESIQKGQIISVRVGASRYSQGSKKVSINAIPYLFSKTRVVYKLNRPIERPELFENVLKRIKYEEGEVSKLNTKAWDTFNQLLYAWKEEPKNAPHTVNLIELASGQTKYKYISRDSRILGSTPLAYVYDEPPLDASVKEVGANDIDLITKEINHFTDEVILTLLEDYCGHMRTVREMVEIYSTPDLLAAHGNLWLLFKKSKF